MEKMGRKRQETKQKILDVSKEYFNKKGYRDTLIIDIAKTCELDRRTIYRYFPTKENILIYITAELFDEFTTAVMEYEFLEEDSAYEKLSKLFGYYFNYLKEQPQMIHFLGMVDVYVGKNMYDREDFLTLDQHGKRLDVVLESLIKEGQENACMKTNFSPKDYAVTINNALIALATRTAIYRPNSILKQEGYAWNLLIIQGTLLLESLKVDKND